MEVVCLILGPMLASQPCLHAFWVLTSLVPRLHPFLRLDGRERVWSIEQTFLSQLWNFVAGVGMKIRPHVNCEYCYYSLEDGE